MKRKLFSCILFFYFAITIQAQNRKQPVQLISDVNEHELYVSFLNTVQIDTKNYRHTLLDVQGMKEIDEEFHLNFERGIAISDEKLAFLESEAIRISGNGASVRKLRNILKVKIENPNNERMLDLAAKLLKLEAVEYCDLLPLKAIPPPADIPPATPNYESAQTYINADPGVNMVYAWGMGLKGAGIKVRDCEYGFNKNHEDLVDHNVKYAPGFTASTSASVDYTEHGTAVFGIIIADKGTYGVSGMAYGAEELVMFSEWPQSGADRVKAVSASIDASTAGDVIIYEMQTEGQNKNYVPAEYTQSIWDLTKAASDAGIIIVAAAGNGNENLDASFYSAYRARGNSGAIMVGAGSPDTKHNKASFSTYGARVDVQGWGSNVRSCGYGNFSKIGNDFNQQYTNFSGTSSATPIVASCVIVLQSYYHDLTGKYMTGPQMRDLLIKTGIPQGTGGHIGPLPNMKAAITSLITTTIEKNPDQVVFNVFPNPAQDKLTISMFNNTSTTAKMEILNAMGQMVYSSDSLTGDQEISIADFQAGLYFVKVTTGQRSAVKKIIKQ